VKKFGTAGQATDDNIIQGRQDAICMQDNYGRNTDIHTHTHTHTHTHRIFNTYCFSAATVVTRTVLSVR